MKLINMFYVNNIHFLFDNKSKSLKTFYYSHNNSSLKEVTFLV